MLLRAARFLRVAPWAMEGLAPTHAHPIWKHWALLAESVEQPQLVVPVGLN